MSEADPMKAGRADRMVQVVVVLPSGQNNRVAVLAWICGISRPTIFGEQSVEMETLKVFMIC